MVIIKLRSSDGDIVHVDLEIIKCSKTILAALDSKSDGNNDPIPVPPINTPLLDKVIEWATYHVDDPEPDPASFTRNNIYWLSGWDKEFLKMEHSALFHLLMAANYLNIYGLQDVICKCLANELHEKSISEMEDTFALERTAENQFWFQK